MAACAALVAVAAVVVVVLVSGGDGYSVRVRFQDAGQLVKGNLVTVAGEQVGEITKLRLTDDGQAEATITVQDDYAPLRRGTRAVIRQRSLSGVANRYIALQLGGADRQEIPSGGTIPSSETQGNVELDAIFNTLDPKGREGLRGTVRFLRDLNQDQERDAREALRNLDPALAASTRLLGELDRSRPDLERFVVQGSRLMTDLSARDHDLAGHVQHLGTTLRALSAQRDDLGEAIERAPDVLRRANTTFVNLRAALDDLDPLVADAKPVVGRDLRPLLAELRPFAADAEPAVRDLSRAIRGTGGDDDLIELLRAQPALDMAANDKAQRNGKERDGALPAMRAALPGATRQLGGFRPYTADLVGWFDDYSTSGVYDALGSFSRAGLEFNQFTLSPVLDGLLPVPLGLRDDLALGTLEVGNNNRCPGSNERPAKDGSNPYVDPDVDCNPKHGAGG
ncbi:MAG: MCE family protein [Solirubrobacterales bacterium]|nr:MCE family protein [Solirubrobacterales bacterium]